MTGTLRWLIGMGALAGTCFLLTAPAFAQSLTLDFDDSTGSTTARIIQLLLLLTVITLAPSLLVMVTSFTRLLVVFSILRHALGTQSTPPNTVLVALALFLTAFIMTPTFNRAWEEGLQPMVNEEIQAEEGIPLVLAPFRDFMLNHVRERDLQLFLDISAADPVASPEQTPMQALIPAFIISELRRAFEIGFLIYLPFIIIDMVVASTLMSMGMMMLPPVMLAMPFKLIFFVLIDGWYLLVGSLVQSFDAFPPPLPG